MASRRARTIRRKQRACANRRFATERRFLFAPFNSFHRHSKNASPGYSQQVPTTPEVDMSERPDFDEPLPDDIEDDEDDIEYIEGEDDLPPDAGKDI